MHDLLAFGSAMYILGLLSCAILVWVLIRITNRIPTDKDHLTRLREEFARDKERQNFKHAVRMCIQEYCSI